MANLSIGILHNTFIPQAAILTCIYSISRVEVSLTSLIFYFIQAPMSFPANYVVDNYGMKVSIRISALLAICGACLKLLINQHFYFVIIGQIFAGSASPFLQNCINKISSEFFAKENRTTITSLLTFFQTITGALGLLMPGIWFMQFNIQCRNNYSLSFEKILKGRQLTFQLCLCQMILVIFLMVPNILFFQDKPPTPPSYSAAYPRENFYNSFKTLFFKSTEYKLITAVFTLFYGGLNILATIVSFLIKPFGYIDSFYSSIISVSIICSGLLGNLFIAKFVKQRYKKFIFVLQGLTIIFLFSMLLALNINFIALIITLSCFGFTLMPLIPLLLEFSCELLFPVSEGSIVGFMYASSQIFSSIIGMIEQLIVNGIDKKRTYYGSLIIAALFIIGMILIFQIKQNLKRINIEEQYEQYQQQQAELK